MLCSDCCMSSSSAVKRTIKQYPKTLLLLSFSVVFTCIVLLIYALVNGHVTLNEDEQLLVSGRTSKTVINGPGRVYFNPFRDSATKRSAMLVAEPEYVHISNTLSGAKKSVAGPELYFLDAYEEASEPQPKIVLKRTEYIKVLDVRTGMLRVVKGPTVFVPAPTEQLEDSIRSAHKLLRHQYLKLTDSATGEVRVMVGEQLVFPEPSEIVSQPITSASKPT